MLLYGVIHFMWLWWTLCYKLLVCLNLSKNTVFIVFTIWMAVITKAVACCWKYSQLLNHVFYIHCLRGLPSWLCSFRKYMQFPVYCTAVSVSVCECSHIAKPCSHESGYWRKLAIGQLQSMKQCRKSRQTCEPLLSGLSLNPLIDWTVCMLPVNHWHDFISTFNWTVANAQLYVLVSALDSTQALWN